MVEANLNQKFIPDFNKWVIIANKTYDKLRTRPGYEGFRDLPQVA